MSFRIATLGAVTLAIPLWMSAASLTCAQDASSIESRALTVVAINTPGAKVKVNGVLIGTSPIEPLALSKGDVIEVQKSGFAPLRFAYDGRLSVELYLKRIEPLEPAAASSSDFPWLWVGVGAGAAAAVAIAVVVIASASSTGSEPGIPVPRIIEP